MFDNLFQLIVLFFVIFDPFISFSVFFIATKDMEAKERTKTAFFAVLVAAIISYAFLIFGNGVLTLFATTMSDFKASAGVILGILGIKMVLGQPIANTDN